MFRLLQQDVALKARTRTFLNSCEASHSIPSEDVSEIGSGNSFLRFVIVFSFRRLDERVIEPAYHPVISGNNNKVIDVVVVVRDQDVAWK